MIITIMKMDIPAEAMRMDTPAAVMKTDIPAEAVAADAVPSHLSQVLMSEKPAVHITEEHLMTEHSSIPLMIAVSRLSLSAVLVR